MCVSLCPYMPIYKYHYQRTEVKSWGSGNCPSSTVSVERTAVATIKTEKEFENFFQTKKAQDGWGSPSEIHKCLFGGKHLLVLGRSHLLVSEISDRRKPKVKCVREALVYTRFHPFTSIPHVPEIVRDALCKRQSSGLKWGVGKSCKCENKNEGQL